jgi:hypothetical protein
MAIANHSTAQKIGVRSGDVPKRRRAIRTTGEARMAIA